MILKPFTHLCNCVRSPHNVDYPKNNSPLLFIRELSLSHQSSHLHKIHKLNHHSILSRARCLPSTSHCQPAEALKLRYGGQTRPTSVRTKRAQERSYPLRRDRMASTRTTRQELLRTLRLWGD